MPVLLCSEPSDVFWGHVLHAAVTVLTAANAAVGGVTATCVACADSVTQGTTVVYVLVVDRALVW